MRSLAVACLVAVGVACANRLSIDTSSGGSSPGELPPLAGDHPTVGLISAVGAPGMLRADWRVPPSVASGLEVALFVGSDRSTLFDTPPIPASVATPRQIVRGLALDAELCVGLGLRQGAEGAYSPSGPVLTVSTRSPIFVDVGADAGGDGLTPESAFNDLLLGVLIASSQGNGNVWVVSGDYPNAAFPIYTGVCVSGGFTTDLGSTPRKLPLRPTHHAAHLLDEEQFARLLDARDPERHPTRLIGAAGQAIAKIESGIDAPAVLDGLRLDGVGTAAAGVDDTEKPLELRSLSIQRCQRGIKLRSTPALDMTRVVISGVSAFGCELEGISVDGAFDLTLEATQCSNNQNEGMDLNALVAPSGDTARLVVRGSSFDGNATEGLEVHLAAPPAGGAEGGLFEITVQDCDFTANGLGGLGIDVDYEPFPSWRSSVVVRGARARANRRAGVELDVDSHATVLVHRLASSANAADGLIVSSETFAGTVTVSASSLMGNLGAGIRASGGNVGVLASHCLLAGNEAGGFVSEVVPGLAVSSIAYLQASPWTGSVSHDGVAQDSSTPPLFQRVAREFARAVAGSTTQIELAAPPSSPAGTLVEIGDDDVARTSTMILGASIAITPAAEPLVLPAAVAFFDRASDAGVVDDLRVAPSSAAVGAGMSPPGGASIDAGPFGSPRGGPPGRDDAVPPVLFYVGSIEPAWTAPLARGAELRLRFIGGEVDVASAMTSVFAVDAAGNSLPITLFGESGDLVVAPPLSGWNGDEVLELCAGLRSTGGVPLACPIGVPIRVR